MIQTELAQHSLAATGKFHCINLEGLREKTDGRVDVLSGLVRLALSVGREQMEAINQQMTLGNVSGLVRWVHALRNTFVVLEASSGIRIAEAIEFELMEHRTLPTPNDMLDLNEAFDGVERDLLDYIETHAVYS
jgi:hypothetical protein